MRSSSARIALRLVVLAVLVGALLPARRWRARASDRRSCSPTSGSRTRRTRTPPSSPAPSGRPWRRVSRSASRRGSPDPRRPPVVALDVDQMDESSCGTDAAAGRPPVPVRGLGDRRGPLRDEPVHRRGGPRHGRGPGDAGQVVDRLGAPIPIGAAPPGSGDGPTGCSPTWSPMGLGLLAAFARGRRPVRLDQSPRRRLTSPAPPTGWANGHVDRAGRSLRCQTAHRVGQLAQEPLRTRAQVSYRPPGGRRFGPGEANRWERRARTGRRRSRRRRCRCSRRPAWTAARASSASRRRSA